MIGTVGMQKVIACLFIQKLEIRGTLVFDILDLVFFKDEKVGGVDRICGCKLAEIIMLNMRGGFRCWVVIGSRW